MSQNSSMHDTQMLLSFHGIAAICYGSSSSAKWKREPHMVSVPTAQLCHYRATAATDKTYTNEHDSQWLVLISADCKSREKEYQFFYGVGGSAQHHRASLQSRWEVAETHGLYWLKNNY